MIGLARILITDMGRHLLPDDGDVLLGRRLLGLVREGRSN